ncbi:hypothetical protein [Pectobacterium brasiliense]|uniref:hypothetical protein n=1 Tax=Pectobacterium brasiliense TaxID=180957 RepID=UPI0025A21194|nr:hypothetical protein [Pectobacterium brasiliense]WJM80524.1 hypothetical protein QTI90_20020 [Pectobacterium brasiliense]
MSTEQSRADFERTMQKRLGSLIDFTRNTHDDYIRLDAAVAWISCQASRSALVVELPKSIDQIDACKLGLELSDAYGMSWGSRHTLDHCASSIRAAGITVKEG